MKIHRIDHVGIIANDLPAAKAFFLDLGLEMMGEGEGEGEWSERIIELQDVKAEVAMLRTPDVSVLDSRYKSQPILQAE